MSNYEIRKKIISFNFMLLIIISSLTGIFLIDNVTKIVRVKADSTWEITTDSDFKNGTLEDVEINGIGSEAELILEPSSRWIKELSAETPEIGWRHKISSIYGKDKVLFFGGGRYDPTDDTWIYDYSENKWVEKMLEYKPGPRCEHAMAPIYGTNNILLFGGEYDNFMDSFYYSDTWLYNMSDNNWSKKEPNNSPGPRKDHYLASVYGDDKVVLFGGYYYAGGGNWITYDDIWIYDLSENTWTERKHTIKPKLKGYYGMSSIYGTDKILLITGKTYDSSKGYIYGDTWIYDVSDDKWTNKTKTNQITPITGEKMAPIYGTDKVLLFGGYHTIFTRDTWIYDLSENKWSKKTTLNNPIGEGNHELASIFGSDRILMIGSYDNAIWTFDLSKNNWYNMTSLIAPYGLHIGLAAIYGTDKIVHFGGSAAGASNDLWVFDYSDSKWEKKLQEYKPSARYYHSLSPIYGTDKILLFGGAAPGENNSYNCNDTWIYDLSENKWTNKKPIDRPKNRINHDMAAIYGTDKVLLAGGYFSNGSNSYYCNDSWIYDLSNNSWTKIISTSNLSYRRDFALSSIDGDDKVILFGGYYYDGNKTYYFNDTWIFDLSKNDWTQKFPYDSPTGSHCDTMSMVYGTDKVVLFIGIHDNCETWIYDLSDNNWIKKSIDLNPNLHYHNFMVPIFGTKKIFLSDGNGYNIWLYNFISNTWTFNSMFYRPTGYGILKLVPIFGVDKAILTGGNSINWVYDNSDNSWEKKVAPLGPNGLNRADVATIWNTDKILYFGGQTQSGYLNETWIYDLSETEWIKKYPKNNPGGWENFKLATILTSDNILFFGIDYNYSSGKYDKETWIYDLSKNNWMKLNPIGEPSPNAFLLLTSFNNDDKVILIDYDNAWIFDLSENKWTNKKYQDQWLEPNYNYKGCNFFGNDNILLYGGDYNDPDTKPMTLIYDFNNNTWTKFILNYYPGYDYGQSMAPIYGTNKIVHFGGNDDDTWVFYLNYYKNGTFKSPKYNTGSSSIFKTFKWEEETNKYTIVKFQIRTGSTITNLTSKDFVGPDGTISTFYTKSPSLLWHGHNNDSWVQFKAFLNTSYYYQTPILKEIMLTYNSCPKLLKPNVIPSYGDVTDKFNFTVQYLDNDNDSSLFIIICIDGVNYSMIEFYPEDNIFSDGKDYWYATKLKAGNHTIQFFTSDGELNYNTTITNISVHSGPLHRIKVEPSSATLEINEYLLLSASGYDIDNNTLSISPIWSVSGGGTIDQTGNFTAKTIGTWIIYANYSSITGNTTINVVENKDNQSIDYENISKPDINDSKKDSDNDGMPDDWEKKYGLNFTDPKDALLDFDQDNLTNLEEYLNNTDPTNPDTDNDTLLDGDEIKIYNTDPLNPDSDTDGQDDGKEIENDTDPLDDKEPDKEEENKSSEQKNDYLIYIISGIIIIIILIIAAFYLIVKWKKK